MAIVAYQPEKGADWEQAELVAIKGSWVTLKTEDKGEFKVRKGQVALSDDGEPDEEAVEALLNGEEFDDEGPVHRGDVFPEGIRETYVKGKTEDGATFIDCGDDVAEQLRGMSLEAVAEVASKILGQRSPAGWLALYTTDREEAGKNPLNPGMVRMNLGNRIRAALKRQEEEAQKPTKSE